jgi:hypothetical protein
VTLNENAVQPVAFTIDQVNCRFGENGPYEQEYATVRIFVTKIIETKDATSGQTMVEERFLDGEYESSLPTVTCAFRNGLKKGVYLVLYSVDFLKSHPLQRIILSTYCEDETKM